MEWRVSGNPVPYADAIDAMERRVRDIRDGTARELVWLLQHPALYTAGTSAEDFELLDAAALPVHVTGRGGRYTYHGPGQRVAYVMVDLKRRKPDVHAYVGKLEDWLIRTLAHFGIEAEGRPDRIGIWVQSPGGAEDKIAAIGVRVRRWVSYHGISLNVAPNLDHYAGIIPCGIQGHGVTSLAALGITADMDAVDTALRSSFELIFASETVAI